MDKLIAIVYALYVASLLTGCGTTKADYEIHLFLDRGGEVNGYVEIDGKKHSIKGEYNDD